MERTNSATGTVEGDTLRGTMTLREGREIEFTGSRVPGAETSDSGS